MWGVRVQISGMLILWRRRGLWQGLLVDVAYSSGINYDNLVELEAQYDTHKKDFKTQLQLIVCKSGLCFSPRITCTLIFLHLALCCFMKISLEASAETISSVINNHGCKKPKQPASQSTV